MLITKELVEKLSDENITKKEYTKILGLIGDKADVIWQHICKVSKRRLDWWAFRNDVAYGHGNGSSGGEFDPEYDMEFIEIIGDNQSSNNPFYPFNDGFPTEYLWIEDWTSLVQEAIDLANQQQQEDKAKKAKKKTAKTIKKTEIIEIIKKKLTAEELKYVKFK